ncbi:MAG: ABC transporter permease [Kiritimatiellae bacterium]|nr:ABC transporter permease [Kiritimatiellia bacterium]
MRRILSISAITIRSAVRSRTVITLLALLLLAIVGLPLTIRGDGTLAGHVQILLSYTLGLAAVLLAIQTVWIGCTAVSAEIEDRQMQLVVTKPVHTWEIWLGKWFGILILSTCLLAFAGAATYGLLRWTTRPARLSAEDQRRLREEVLVARRALRPLPIDLDRPARRILAERRAAGDLPDDVTDEQAYQAIRERLRLEANAVATGMKRRWEFRLPAVPGEEQPLFLRYKLTSSGRPGQEIEGLWFAGPEPNPDTFQKPARSVSTAVYEVRVPPEAVGPDGRLVVEYANINPDPVTILFAGEDDLELLLYAGSFEANYLRGLLVLFIELAFLAAIGLTAGSLFSMPVAVFTSAWIVLLTNIGRYLQSMAARQVFFDRHGAPYAGPTFWDHFFRWFFKFMSALVRPLQGPNPLELLSAGQIVSWALVGFAFLARVAVYTTVLALFSSWVLGRRELGVQE